MSVSVNPSPRPQRVLVAGGTGGVGEAIVAALLDAGHEVIVPSRTAVRIDLLRERLGRARAGGLSTMTGAIGEADGAIELRDRIVGEFGRVDVVVPSLGGWWEGDLLDATPAVWDAVMDEMLRSHFIFARTFIPMLRDQPGGGRYIAIGGGAAYTPIPRSSLVSIAGAAQLMMTRALAAETGGSVDILELVVDGPVRTRDSESIAASWWIDAAEVGVVVADLVTHGRAEGNHLRLEGPLLQMLPTRRSAERAR